jgi:phage terminase small subunit
MSARIDPETGLTEQARRFADEYLIDFNATEAYKRAGYKAKGQAAHSAASRLLGDERVQQYLTARKAELTEKVEVDQEKVLQRLTALAFGDVRQLFDLAGNLKPMHELTADQAAMLQGIEVLEVYEGRGKDREFVGNLKKVKLVPRLESVKTLGLHYGMFKQEHQHTHRVAGLRDILDDIDGSDTGPGPASSRRA